MKSLFIFLCLALLPFGFGACSIKKRAVNTLAEVLDQSETVYLSDDDPDLVAAAMPFNLKTLETLLQASPKHRGLLLSLTKSFIFYTYGFVEPEAERIEEDDFYRAREIRQRAARLYSRAYAYGLRGLELTHPGISLQVSREPELASRALEADDVPLAVWTAAALGLSVGVSMNDAEKTADIAVVGALLNRARELEPGYENGTIYEFLVLYESKAFGGSKERAAEYFQQAVALSGGRRCGIWLTWAENISIAQQDRAEFDEMISRVIDCDIEATPENRLLNTLAKRRAHWLRTHTGDFFLENGGNR